jgi:hypothetical protein
VGIKMTDVNETLNELAQARESYKDFVAAVDADLARERQRRLAVRQGEILHLVAKAYAEGGSKRAIMGAYRTKDFRTIQRMLDSMEEQIALIQAEIAASDAPETHDWFELVRKDYAYISGLGFDIFELEGEEYMLSQVADEGDTSGWDGRILTPADSGNEDDAGILYRAIHERWSTDD